MVKKEREDSRKVSRQPCCDPILVRVAAAGVDFSDVAVYLTDISPRGLGLTSSFPFAVGDQFSLVSLPPSSRAIACYRVVHVRPIGNGQVRIGAAYTDGQASGSGEPEHQAA